jgi:O-glycosyl hydrolase
VAAASSATIVLRHDQAHQVVEGFGTCINSWDAAVAAAYRRSDFATFYQKTLGASALRIELWGGAAPLARSDWRQISSQDFRLAGSGGRGALTIEIAQRLSSAYEGSLRIFATAWTPPAWMKENASLGNGHPARTNFALNLQHPIERGTWTQPTEERNGAERFKYVARNKLRRDAYLHFAKLLVEWTRYLRSVGISLYALSPANEPLFSHWFESCVYTPAEYAELVESVAWMFANQGEPPIPLFGPEHITRDVAGNRLYLDALAQRGTALRALAAVASHGYVDGYAADLRRESSVAFGDFVRPYGKKAWITEGTFGSHGWPAPLHGLAASFIYALRDGGASVFLVWQAVTRDPPEEHGLMSLGGPTKKTAVAMQLWRFVKPGMVRIGVEASSTLDAVAFRGPDHDHTVLVLLNRRAEPCAVTLRSVGKPLGAIQAAYLTDGERDCAAASGWNDLSALRMPAESLATLVMTSAR